MINKEVLTNLPNCWQPFFNDAFGQDYFLKLENFLETENELYTIHPKQDLIFSAFQLTPFSKVKVVILGQDPYHGYNQAHGLAFSVPDGVKIPPSLTNIYKELHSDLSLITPQSGNLSHWATEGVLLLNSVLTVRNEKPASHAGKGWEVFTDSVINYISSNKKNIVFILWGNYAKSKTILIDSEKHFVISSAHPSPLSAYQGFWGSKPFSKTNTYLKEHQIETITWELPKPKSLLF